MSLCVNMAACECCWATMSCVTRLFHDSCWVHHKEDFVIVLCHSIRVGWRFLPVFPGSVPLPYPLPPPSQSTHSVTLSPSTVVSHTVSTWRDVSVPRRPLENKRDGIRSFGRRLWDTGLFCFFSSDVFPAATWPFFSKNR